MEREVLRVVVVENELDRKMIVEMAVEVMEVGVMEVVVMEVVVMEVVVMEVVVMEVVEKVESCGL